ncbi:MAG TPA: hypothetical protein PKK58_11430 [Opitutaceae bacterium]|nr:hypothetical protein [Opitutaceae bacterium]HQL21014.1 hypothetical protein [Opitutaceae bacterium]
MKISRIFTNKKSARGLSPLVAMHLPFNEGEILSYFTNGYYSALAD